MKFDPTKPVQTKSGKPARILATDRKNSKYPIIALVTYPAGGEEVESFRPNGIFYGDASPSERDLVNVPEKRTYERWVNVYADGSAGGPHLDRQSADSAGAHTGRVACIHIKREYVEGEGL